MNRDRLARPRSVAFFPSTASMAANPYWTTLARELGKRGIHVRDDTPDAFDGRWLLQNRGEVSVLHIHYIHQFYMSRGRRTHLPGVLRFAFRLLLARAVGYRTVFTLHNLEPTSYLEPRWLDTLGHRLAAQMAERVIVHCEEARRLLRAHYGRSREVFIVEHPNYIGIYPNSISTTDARSRLGLPHDATVFLFFGGVRPNKGIELLLQAFQSLDSGSLRLVVAGECTGSREYAQVLQRLANEDVRVMMHLQRVSDEEVQVFMRAADVVVLPFARVLTSSSAILAMSFGRPIIVPRIGCMPALVGSDAGWLFDAADLDSLATVMQEASCADLVETGEAARRRISAFTPGQFAAQTMRAYGVIQESG